MSVVLHGVNAESLRHGDDSTIVAKDLEASVVSPDRKGRSNAVVESCAGDVGRS